MPAPVKTLKVHSQLYSWWFWKSCHWMMKLYILLECRAEDEPRQTYFSASPLNLPTCTWLIGPCWDQTQCRKSKKGMWKNKIKTHIIHRRRKATPDCKMSCPQVPRSHHVSVMPHGCSWETSFPWQMQMSPCRRMDAKMFIFLLRIAYSSLMSSMTGCRNSTDTYAYVYYPKVCDF